MFSPFVRYVLSITERSSSVRKRLNVSLPPPCGIAPGEVFPLRPAAEAVGVKSRVRSVLITPGDDAGRKIFSFDRRERLADTDQ